MAKTTKKTAPASTPAAEKPTTEANAPSETLCTFAFRLTEAERDAIHKAAGPRGASAFARRVLAEASNIIQEDTK